MVIGRTDDDVIDDDFPFPFIILFLPILNEISIIAIVGAKPNATHTIDSNASIDWLCEVCKLNHLRVVLDKSKMLNSYNRLLLVIITFVSLRIRIYDAVACIRIRIMSSYT